MKRGEWETEDETRSGEKGIEGDGVLSQSWSSKLTADIRTWRIISIQVAAWTGEQQTDKIEFRFVEYFSINVFKELANSGLAGYVSVEVCYELKDAVFEDIDNL